MNLANTAVPRGVSATQPDQRSCIRGPQILKFPSLPTAPTGGGTEPPAMDPVVAAPVSSVPTPELLAELAHLSTELERAAPMEILEWSVQRFAPGLTMGTAFGPEGMCIIHMLATIAPDTPIFNLETGYQFPETLALVDRIRDRYGIEVRLERPDQSVADYEQLHGGPLYKTNPDQCCHDRKIRVLERVARGHQAWISAIRRDQSADRARASVVGWDKKFGLAKVNPLVNWTKKDVWKLITDEKIPYNPLHDQGYTSIGCWPCTRAVMFGEDERAGRWSGSAKTECGLHKLD